MRKLILTFIAVVGFSFASSSQCDDYSTLVTTDCGSRCLSVVIPLTGITSVDSNNWINSGVTMRRKPTLREALMFADAAC